MGNEQGNIRGGKRDTLEEKVEGDGWFWWWWWIISHHPAGAGIRELNTSPRDILLIGRSRSTCTVRKNKTIEFFYMIDLWLVVVRVTQKFRRLQKICFMFFYTVIKASAEC